MGRSKSVYLYFYQLWILYWACSGCLSCAPPPPTSLSEDSLTLSLPRDGIQALLPHYPFTCSGLLRELVVQANGDSELQMQIWRPESESESFRLLWAAKYRPDYDDTDELFRRIGTNTLQWTSKVGVPIQPGDVFGLHTSRSNSSMRIPHSSESSQKLYYVNSEEPLCNFALCDRKVQMLKNVSFFITTTVFEKTSNLSLAEEQLSKMKVFCHKANFSSCPRIQRTKRSGMTGQPPLPISPSLPCSTLTPTPTPTPPPTTHSTQTNTTSGSNPPPPPGYVIKISPEAIAFIIVGVLLLVIVVVLVFVLVFCLRTKGVKVEQSASSPSRVPELAASVDSRTTRGITASTSAAERSTEVVSARHPHQRSASHHYINGEISHRGIFSSFFPLYENTSSSPLTHSTSTSSHEHLRNERVFSTSALQSNRLSPPNFKPPYRARSVGPSARLCTGIQAPPVPPRGQSRSRGGTSNETQRYSVLEASTDPAPLQDRRRAQSCGGRARTRVNKRELTPHDYAEPDSPSDTKEEFMQSLKYDKLIPHEGSPQFDLSGSLVPGPRERGNRALSEDHSYSDPDGLWSSMELSSSCNYTYVPTEDQRRMANSDHYEMQDDFQQESEMTYDRLRFFEERETYWAPATTESGLYTQLSENKYRELPRSEIRVIRQIGSGHFGTVSMGIWESGVDPQPVEVAIKTVKACSDLERIKLLQEAAIMGQFAHCNVVRLLGVVTVGDPALVILEYMVKGDLRSFLQKLHPKVSKRELPEVVPRLFIKFSKDIANGMGYLSKKNFVHRDLAARNILLNNDLTCKIGDFGMARDVENDYYKSHGGIIPVKWTAPEALNYNKFSSSSDVWSYGMVLFEIWSIGEKPFNELTNPIVIALVSSKHCQAPPPGCPRAIYHLMVECWNPDASKRPTFDSIHTYLDSPIENLTYWHAGDMIPDRRAHIMAAPLREANNLYLQLQRTYQKPLIGNAS